MPESFHFLRPETLWLLLPAGLALAVLARRQEGTARWRGVIAPHLLEHLVVRPKRRWGLRPLHALALGMVLMAAAVAGPAWQREPSPFTDDTAPLVIALELTPRMLVHDVQPSRLERARQKVRDLATARGGARTALLVYAGSGHTVMPLTDDPAALTAFAMDLEPDLMPVAGVRPETVLPLATGLLERDGTPGTLLLIAPGIPEGSVDALAGFGDERRDQLQLLVMATEAGGPIPDDGFSSFDRVATAAFEEATGAVVTPFTVDESDVERVLRRSRSHLESVQQEDPDSRWRDEGWWLCWPVAGLVLLWFRRGWTISWET